VHNSLSREHVKMSFVFSRLFSAKEAQLGISVREASLTLESSPYPTSQEENFVE
jgi:hypothetical protein